MQLETHRESGSTTTTYRGDLDLVEDVGRVGLQHTFPQAVEVAKRWHRCGQDRLLHGGADVVLSVRFGLATIHQRVDVIDRIAAVIEATDVERTVLVAASEAAHVPDLFRLEMLAEFVVYYVLRAGHQTGAAIAHIGFDALVAALQEIVEGTGAVRDGFTYEEFIRNSGECFGGG